MTDREARPNGNVIGVQHDNIGRARPISDEKKKKEWFPVILQ